MAKMGFEERETERNEGEEQVSFRGVYWEEKMTKTGV